jgi:hypothetical protein
MEEGRERKKIGMKEGKKTGEVRKQRKKREKI